jgi:outer membrane PBP1 activator LpoA protein
LFSHDHRLLAASSKNPLSKHTVAATVKGRSGLRPQPARPRLIALSHHLTQLTGLVGLILTMGLLSSCATTTPTQSLPPIQTPANLEQASPSQLLALARTAAPRTAAVLYLNAAWSLLEGAQLASPEQPVEAEPATEPSELPAEPDPAASRSRDLAAAVAAYRAIEPGWLAPDRLPDYQLLAARVAVLEGNLPAALSAMRQVPAQARGSERARFAQSGICALQGDYDCALAQLLAEGGEQNLSHNELIWQYLDADAVQTPAGGTVMEPPLLAGWRALHRVATESFSIIEASAGTREWLAANPDHPAALAPPAAVAALAEYQPESYHVALLLPLSGPVALAGEAVRDGFIGASLLAGRNERFRLSVYDTAADPLPLLYERVLEDNVDLIVGPLRKEVATALNDLSAAIPVLLLNYLDPESEPGAQLSQFGLAIEDEAATIADRLASDGIQTALLFHNYEDWSMRARRTLVESASGDLTVQPFTDMRTITEAVGSAMHVAGSQARRDELAAMLGVELEFLPRARGDVDAVVALIDNQEANALVPALRFHFANHLPVYASSQVARRSRSDRLEELNGFRISELPWFVEGNPLYATMRRAFALDSNPYASLVALGVDAFRLSDRLQLPGARSGFSISGSTGALTFGADGRVSRQLVWARVLNGRLSPDLAVAP